MSRSPEDALERARWGALERGEYGLDPKDDFRVFEIVFTASGFGYFHLLNLLTTRQGNEDLVPKAGPEGSSMSFFKCRAVGSCVV